MSGQLPKEMHIAARKISELTRDSPPDLSTEAGAQAGVPREPRPLGLAAATPPAWVVASGPTQLRLGNQESK